MKTYRNRLRTTKRVRKCRKCHEDISDPRGVCATCEKQLVRYDIELKRQNKEGMLRRRGWIR